MRKNIPLPMQNSINKGIKKFLIKKYCREKSYANALPIRKVAANATMA